MRNLIELAVQMKSRLAKAPVLVAVFALVFVISVGMACNAPARTPDQTQVAADEQATLSALQTDQILQITQTAQAVQSGGSNQAADDAKATLDALAAQTTMAVQQATTQAQAAAALRRWRCLSPLTKTLCIARPSAPLTPLPVQLQRALEFAQRSAQRIAEA
jgi:hypothetical protein